MSQLVKHLKVSTIADGPDPNQVNPSDWNAAHVFSGGAQGGLLMRDTGDATYGASWLASVAAGNVLISNGVGAPPTWASSLTLAGNLTVNGVFTALGFGSHSFSAGAAGANVLTVANTAPGSGNIAAIVLNNDIAVGVAMYALASTYAGGGDAIPNGGLIRGTGAGGLTLSVTNTSALLRLFTNGAERLRIDASGNYTFFGAGAVNMSATTLSVGPQLAIRNPTNSATATTDLLIGNDSTASLLDVATYASSRTTTAGFDLPNSTVFYHTGSGGLAFCTAHGSASLTFWTAAAKRWTIDNTGVLSHGTIVGGSEFISLALNNGTGLGKLAIGLSAASGVMLNFYTASGGAGAITVSGTATNYGTSSDARLKRDRGIARTTDRLARLVVHDFDWIADGRPGRGVFAQEVAGIVPEAVTEGDADLTVEGTKPWTTDYSKYVPDLIVGWQQHADELAALRADLAALKG